MHVLTWIPDEFAATHDVYLGTAFDAVSNASVADPGGVLAGPGLTDTSFDPGRLELDQTYYWRVELKPMTSPNWDPIERKVQGLC